MTPSSAQKHSLRLLIWALVFFGLSLIAGAAYTLHRLHHETLSQKTHAAEGLARSVELFLTQSLGLVEDQMLNLAFNPRWRNRFSEGAELASELQAMIVRSPALRSVSVLDSQGYVVASSNPDNIGHVLSFEGFLPPMNPGQPIMQLRLGPVWQGRDFAEALSPSLGTRAAASPVARIFWPVARPFEHHGETWTILASLNPDHFLNHIERLLGKAESNNDRTQVVHVLRYDGTLLFSTSDHAIPGALHRSRDWLLTALEAELGALYQPHIPERYIEVFRASSRFPLLVDLSHSSHDVLASWHREARTLGLLILTVLISTLVLAFVFIRRLLAAYRQEAKAREGLLLAATVYEASAQGIMIVDPDVRVISVNPAFCRMTGYRFDEFYGQNPRILSSGQHDSAFYRRMWETLLLQGTWEGEIINRRKDGQIIYEWLSINQVRDPEGRLTHYIGIFTDITEQRRNALDLRKLSMAVQQSQSSIVITNLEGTLEYVNPCFTRQTGYSAEEVLGENPRFLQSGETDKATYEALWARLLQGEPWEGEFINRRKDGTLYTEHAVIAPVRDLHGEVTHYVGVKHDISERVRMEHELRKARNQALAATQAKSAFLATMSHELRTPMNGVMGMIQLLRSEPGMPVKTRNDYLDLAYDSALQLLNIINDILDYSKMEAEKTVLEPVSFDLARFIRELITLLGTLARDKGILLRCEIDPDIGQVYMDMGRLRQILINLIGNGIKFTRQGEVVVSVREAPSLDPAQHCFDFAVRDTGIGMTSEVRESLFEPFVQGDSRVNRDFQGTGLGLAICKRALDLLGSRMEVRSTPGGGSLFAFRLCVPCTAPQKEPIVPTNSP
jgi:PAS domain S-box-containing protein